ncbi:MAG: ABC transporter substrate-binding protein [Verrucomicrobiota bacterium]|nr:ABC transporter substrate-binding protein [Verrucomicrobiota bacterium]
MNTHAIPRKLSLLLAVTAFLLNLGCSRQKTGSLRLGINGWPGHEFLYLAREKDFFREEGLEVSIIEFNSLSDSRRAYERGQIDAMGSTVIEVLQTHERSRRSPEIVQIVDHSDGADVILARPGIDSCAALRGARVGVELASIGIYVLTRGLEKSGLSVGDIETVPMDESSMEHAFRNGELDAIVTYPPTSVRLLRDLKISTVFSSAEIPGEVVDVIAVEAEVNSKRPADVARLLRAFHRAIAYTRQNPRDAHRIMAEREGITPMEFREALSGGIRLVPQSEQAAYLRPGGKLAAVIDTSDRVLRQSGQIKGPDRRGACSNASFLGEDVSP